MKIELGGSVVSQASVERSVKQVSTGAIRPGGSVSEDRATLSSDSTSVQSLVGQALTSPAVRQDKVDALRQSISSGEYKLDSNKIASAILSEGGQ